MDRFTDGGYRKFFILYNFEKLIMFKMAKYKFDSCVSIMQSLSMKNNDRVLAKRISTLSRVILICVFSLAAIPHTTTADPADQPQPQGSGVVKEDGTTEWNFGPNRSREETEQQIPNQEDAPEFTPEQEKEAQDILDKVYSDPELGGVRKLFDDMAEQNRLEREGLLPKKEPQKLSPFDEAYLRGQVIINGWIEFWRQFVPASIFPFPKEKDPSLEKDPLDKPVPDANPQPDLTPKAPKDSNPEPPKENSEGSKDSGFFKDPANNPWYSPDPAGPRKSDENFGASKGLFEGFNDFWWDGNRGGVPPTSDDDWNFLPGFKPHESVYENQPDPSTDPHPMPIADPVPLQIPEEENKPSQVLINGSMPFDPNFDGSLGGVNEKPEEDYLKGLEMAMDSYGHVSVKINGQFVPVDQATKEQLKAEHERIEAEKAKPSAENQKEASASSKLVTEMRKQLGDNADEVIKKITEPDSTPSSKLTEEMRKQLGDKSYDVIKKILDKHGPLTKEEVIDKVLKERYVKENTIVVNLQNQKYFHKDKEGRYSPVAA